VGEIARSASDNRSALDRERNRWLAFKRDVAEAAAGATGSDSDWPAFRADWLRDFYAFEAFYRSNYDNIMGDLWPLSDLQSEIDEWAAVLNTYRERFRELTGRDVSLPVARSGRRGRVGPSLGFSAFGTGALLLGLGAVGLLAFGGRSGG
jgi:hypothetical protein